MLNEAEEAACDNIARHYGLTEREAEVLKLAVEGKTNPQIEVELYITHNTLKTHLLHIHRKLGIHTRDEVIALVEEYKVDKADKGEETDEAVAEKGGATVGEADEGAPSEVDKAVLEKADLPYA